MRKPVKEDNAVEKALMDGVGKWVNAFNAFPIPYEIDLVSLAAMVRSAYEEVATQPGFRVSKAHKGPLWEIEPAEKRVDDPSNFYPHVLRVREEENARLREVCRRASSSAGSSVGLPRQQPSKETYTSWKTTGPSRPSCGQLGRGPGDQRHLDRERPETAGGHQGQGWSLRPAAGRPPGQQPGRLPPDGLVQGSEPVPSDRRQRLETRSLQGESLSAESMNAYAFLSNLKATAERQNLNLDGLTQVIQEKPRAHAKKTKQRLRRRPKEKEEKGLTSKVSVRSTARSTFGRARTPRPRRPPCASGLGVAWTPPQSLLEWQHTFFCYV